MELTKETIEQLAAVAGIALTDTEAAALAAAQGPAVQSLARYPDAALSRVEPPVWFRPLARRGEG